MIVRILGEGQFRVSDSVMDRINEVDNRLVDLVAKNDRDGFARVYHELFQAIRRHCEPVPDEELVESDVVLPPEDTTFEEAKDLFLGEGIVPG
jgi:hypothetical protein